MAGKPRERIFTSSDLDIFGDIPDETTEDATLDIFGSNESGNDEAAEPATEEATETETPEAEKAEPQEEEATETDTEEAAEMEPVEESDIDIDKLFDDIEEEAQKEGNDELTKLVDTLRTSIAEKDSELLDLRKQNEIMRDKLLSKAGDDAEYGIYKPLLDNIESNRPLKFLATYYSSDMSDKNKERTLDILSGFIEELTGQDVSGLITKSQTDKINAIGGGSSATAMENKTADKDMNYEESTTRLF